MAKGVSIMKNNENFIAVLNDQAFETPVSIFSKDYGLTVAQQIQGKISRKVQSSLVISLSDASHKGEYKKLLSPSANLHTLYRLHPLESSRYLSVSTFHETLLREKKDELCALLKGVGAKFVSFANNRSWNKSYLVPENSLTDLASEDEQLENPTSGFLPFQPDWQKCLKDRKAKWSKNLQLTFVYDDSYMVNDSMIEVLMTKMGLSKKEKESSIKVVGKTRSQSALDSNEVYKLFTAVKDTVDVEFFTPEEYKAENLRILQKTWKSNHIRTFLRVLGMEKFFQDFRDHGIDGRTITRFSTPSLVADFLPDATEDECELLSTAIKNLGDVDHLQIITVVNDTNSADEAAGTVIDYSPVFEEAQMSSRPPLASLPGGKTASYYRLEALSQARSQSGVGAARSTVSVSRSRVGSDTGRSRTNSDGMTRRKYTSSAANEDLNSSRIRNDDNDESNENRRSGSSPRGLTRQSSLNSDFGEDSPSPQNNKPREYKSGRNKYKKDRSKGNSANDEDAEEERVVVTVTGELSRGGGRGGESYDDDVDGARGSPRRGRKGASSGDVRRGRENNDGSRPVSRSKARQTYA